MLNRRSKIKEGNGKRKCAHASIVAMIVEKIVGIYNNITAPTLVGSFYDSTKNQVINFQGYYRHDNTTEQSPAS